MNQDADLKLIEHTEMRAKNMLRLCDLARDGLKYRGPSVTEANRNERQSLEGFGEMCKLEAEDFILSRYAAWAQDDTRLLPSSTAVFAHLCRLHPDLSPRSPRPIQWVEGLLRGSTRVTTVKQSSGDGYWTAKGSNPIPQPQAIGGHARAAKLKPERRQEIAKTAANKRWGKK